MELQPNEIPLLVRVDGFFSKFHMLTAATRGEGWKANSAGEGDIIMRHMLLVVSVVAMLAKPAMAADLWWAVAITQEQNAYGATWNYKTREQAEQAAIKSCRERSSSDCSSHTPRKNSCFIVFKSKSGDGRTWFGLGRSFSNRAEAEAHAQEQLRRADRIIRGEQWPRETALLSHTVELLKCAGVR